MFIKRFIIISLFFCFAFVQSMIVPEVAVEMHPEQMYKLSKLSEEVYNASLENSLGFELFASSTSTDIAGGSN